MNGRSTVEQICDVSYLSNFETCRILWALQVLGVIRKGLADDAAALGEDDAARERELDLEEIVETFNQMFSRIYHFLKGRLGRQGGRVHGPVPRATCRASTGRFSPAST